MAKYNAKHLRTFKSRLTSPAVIQKIKQHTSMILALAMVLSLVPVISFAADVTGNFGTEGITWEITGDTLTITVPSNTTEGILPDVDTEDDIPWLEYSLQIKKLVLDGRITYIGDYVFNTLRNLETLSFSSASTLSHIGYLAFTSHYLKINTLLPETCTDIDEYAFSALTQFRVPIEETWVHPVEGTLATETRYQYVYWGVKNPRIISYSLDKTINNVRRKYRIDTEYTVADNLIDIITGNESFYIDYEVQKIHVEFPDFLTASIVHYNKLGWAAPRYWDMYSGDILEMPSKIRVDAAGKQFYIGIGTTNTTLSFYKYGGNSSGVTLNPGETTRILDSGYLGMYAEFRDNNDLNRYFISGISISGDSHWDDTFIHSMCYISTTIGSDPEDNLTNLMYPNKKTLTGLAASIPKVTYITFSVQDEQIVNRGTNAYAKGTICEDNDGTNTSAYNKIEYLSLTCGSLSPRHSVGISSGDEGKIENALAKLTNDSRRLSCSYMYATEKRAINIVKATTVNNYTGNINAFSIGSSTSFGRFLRPLGSQYNSKSLYDTAVYEAMATYEAVPDVTRSRVDSIDYIVSNNLAKTIAFRTLDDAYFNNHMYLTLTANGKQFDTATLEPSSYNYGDAYGDIRGHYFYNFSNIYYAKVWNGSPDNTMIKLRYPGYELVIPQFSDELVSSMVPGFDAKKHYVLDEYGNVAGTPHDTDIKLIRKPYKLDYISNSLDMYDSVVFKHPSTGYPLNTGSEQADLVFNTYDYDIIPAPETVAINAGAVANNIRVSNTGSLMIDSSNSGVVSAELYRNGAENFRVIYTPNAQTVNRLKFATASTANNDSISYTGEILNTDRIHDMVHNLSFSNSAAKVAYPDRFSTMFKNDTPVWEYTFDNTYYQSLSFEGIKQKMIDNTPVGYKFVGMHGVNDSSMTPITSGSSIPSSAQFSRTQEIPLSSTAAETISVTTSGATVVPIYEKLHTVNVNVNYPKSSPNFTKLYYADDNDDILSQTFTGEAQAHITANMSDEEYFDGWKVTHNHPNTPIADASGTRTSTVHDPATSPLSPSSINSTPANNDTISVDAKIKVKTSVTLSKFNGSSGYTQYGVAHIDNGSSLHTDGVVTMLNTLKTPPDNTYEFISFKVTPDLATAPKSSDPEFTSSLTAQGEGETVFVKPLFRKKSRITVLSSDTTFYDSTYVSTNSTYKQAIEGLAKYSSLISNISLDTPAEPSYYFTGFVYDDSNEPFDPATAIAIGEEDITIRATFARKASVTLKNLSGSTVDTFYMIPDTGTFGEITGVEAAKQQCQDSIPYTKYFTHWSNTATNQPIDNWEQLTSGNYTIQIQADDKPTVTFQFADPSTQAQVLYYNPTEQFNTQSAATTNYDAIASEQLTGKYFKNYKILRVSDSSDITDSFTFSQVISESIIIKGEHGDKSRVIYYTPSSTEYSSRYLEIGEKLFNTFDFTEYDTAIKNLVANMPTKYLDGYKTGIDEVGEHGVTLYDLPNATSTKHEQVFGVYPNIVDKKQVRIQNPNNLIENQFYYLPTDVILETTFTTHIAEQTNKTFLFWTLDTTPSPTSTPFQFGNAIGDSDILLYPVYINDPLVTYNTYGGEHGDTLITNTLYVKYNTTLSQSSLPYNGNAAIEFNYWYSGENKNTPFDFTQPLTSDITLTANVTFKTYTISFDAVLDTIQVKYGEKFGELPTTTKLGWTFDKWVDKEGDEVTSTTILNHTWLDKEHKLYAVWTPNRNTPYTVKYSFQSKMLDNFVVNNSMTENLTGTTGSTVYLDAKQVAGFTPVNEQAELVILADGSASYIFNYTRNKYDITYSVEQPDGSSNTIPAQQAAYDTTFTLPDNPTLQGYVFNGWYTDASYNTKYHSAPVTDNTQLYGKFDPAKDTPYFLHIYREQLHETHADPLDTTSEIEVTTTYSDTPAVVEMKGSTDSEVYLDDIQNNSHIRHEGYEIDFVASDNSVTILPSGDAILHIYMTRTKHTVKTTPPQGETPTEPDEYSSIYGQTLASLNLIPYEKEGYDFFGWKMRGTDSVLGLETLVHEDLILEPVFLRAGDTPYTVRYMVRDIGSADTYSLHEENILSGETESEVTAIIKTFTGFEFDADATANKNPASHTNNGLTSTISPDGSTLIEVYYTREKFVVTLPDNTELTFDYGEQVVFDDIPEPTKEGYEFVGWDTDISDGEQVTGDFDLTPIFAPRTDTPYTINHMLQTREDGYELKTTDSLTGTTDTTISVTPNEYTGYTPRKTGTGSSHSLKILADGSAELDIYYDLRTLQVHDTRNGSSIYIMTYPDTYGDIATTHRNKLALPGDTPHPEDFEFVGLYTDSTMAEPVDESEILPFDTLTDVFVYSSWMLTSTASQEGRYSTVTGVDGEGIPNLHIEIYKGPVIHRRSMTDDLGRFSFGDLEDGTYNISIRGNGGQNSYTVVIPTPTGDGAGTEGSLPFDPTTTGLVIDNAVEEIVISGQQGLVDEVIDSYGDKPGAYVEINISDIDPSRNKDKIPKDVDRSGEDGTDSGDTGKRTQVTPILVFDINAEYVDPDTGNNHPITDTSKENPITITVDIPSDFKGDIGDLGVYVVDCDKLIPIHNATENPDDATEIPRYNINTTNNTIEITTDTFGIYVIGTESEISSPKPPVTPERPRPSIIVPVAPSSGGSGSSSGSGSTGTGGSGSGSDGSGSGSGVTSSDSDDTSTPTHIITKGVDTPISQNLPSITGNTPSESIIGSNDEVTTREITINTNDGKTHTVVGATDNNTGDILITLADVNSTDWFANDVTLAALYGLLPVEQSDISDLTYYANPKNPMIRGDSAIAIQSLARLLGFDTTTEMNLQLMFDDMGTLDTTSKKAILWCYARGFMVGTSDAKFSPESTLTREQICTILYRMLGGKELALTGTTANTFNDYNKVSSWAIEAMDWAVRNGIIYGDTNSNLNPQGTLNRAESSAIFVRVYRLSK